MYELKVKDTTGVWHNLDLIPGEEPVMNYQVNIIAELKDRNCDYSQAIKLPKTPTNLRVLERLDLFEASTLMPYKNIECRLFSNGFTLAGKSSIFIVDRVGEYIEGQVLSGNAGLFYTMENRLMEDADLGYTIVGSGALPQWVKWANCINGKLGEEYKTGHYYFANLFQIANRLVELCGYELICNLPETSKNRDVISLASLKPWTDSLEMFNSSAAINVQNLNPHNPEGQALYFKQHITRDIFGMLISENNMVVSTNKTRLLWHSNIEGKIEVHIELNYRILINSPHPHTLFYQVALNGQLIKEVPLTQTAAIIGSLEEKVEVGVNKNDVVTMVCGIRSVDHVDTSSITISSNVEIVETEASVVPTGGKLYFGNNTGFTTYWDCFKTFCQTYGLTVYADENNKVVKAYTMDKLYENKSIAKDWSDKLSRENQELSFIIDGYGQNNFIRFEKKEDLEDKGNFYVSNGNLDKWKDLFTIKWESGEDATKGENRLAVIPLYEYSVDSQNNTVKQEYKGTKPHLVEHTEVSNEFLGVVNHIPAQNLIDKYYDKLANRMLVNAKCLLVGLLLSERDIEELDFFTPIYLKQFGAYFYISKIRNFIAGDRLTKVDLIRL